MTNKALAAMTVAVLAAAAAAKPFAHGGERTAGGTEALDRASAVYEAAAKAFDGRRTGAGRSAGAARYGAAAPRIEAVRVRTQERAFPFKSVTKYAGNPILRPTPAAHGFESNGTFNPAVTLKDGVFYMLYRAQDHNAVSTIGLAASNDGIHFAKFPEPVITPEFDYEKPGGVEDPRIMKVGDTFYVTYTGYNHPNTPSCLATSKDLVHWQKHGRITPAKSAAMLDVPVNGQYWLYYGDTNIWSAHSADLIHWTLHDEPVLRPRDGSWDDSLVEPGPPPIMTKQGILLIYNGNLSEGRARELGRRKGRDQVREYTTGWALFDKNDPARLIARSESPFLTVTEFYEEFGQVGDVVFTEGMVIQGGKAYLYYGGADTTVNVAIGEPAWDAP